MTLTESDEPDADGHQEDLERRVNEVESQVEQHAEIIEQQKEMITYLGARLRWYENAHTPPSKRLPGGLGADTDNDDDADSGKTGETASDGDESSGGAETADSESKTAGRKEGHEGTTRTLSDPDRTVWVDVGYCPNCGRKHVDPDEYRTRTCIDVPHPIPTEVVRYELGVHECDCDSTVTAEHPDCPESGDYGPHLLTLATLFRCHSRLPHRKQVDQFAWLFDHELSHATIYNKLDNGGRSG